MLGKQWDSFFATTRNWWRSCKALNKFPKAWVLCGQIIGPEKATSTLLNRTCCVRLTVVYIEAELRNWTWSTFGLSPCQLKRNQKTLVQNRFYTHPFFSHLCIQGWWYHLIWHWLMIRMSSLPPALDYSGINFLHLLFPHLRNKADRDSYAHSCGEVVLYATVDKTPRFFRLVLDIFLGI